MHGIDDEIRTMQSQAHWDSKRWFPALGRKNKSHRLTHMALGLGEEAGEVLGVIKKWSRKCEPIETLDLASLGAELADTLIYLMHIADITGIDLSNEYWSKRAINEGRFGSVEI